MPRIFDNIEQDLLPALRETLAVSERADFCVGYFNLRGWGKVGEFIEKWSGGNASCCRLLVGMQRLPQEELRDALSLSGDAKAIDVQRVAQLKKKLAEEFRRQLMIGAPTNADEVALQRLAHQIKTQKVIAKLFLRHPLHAKLYLLYRQDYNNPISGYLGSSNLTLAGLSHQGELNVDVLEYDACQKLEKWFNDRWNDKWCLDISEELANIIEGSWARKEALQPYYIYLKMAYHLAQEARAGLTEFKLPSDLQNKLWDFQAAAVKIAAHHLNKRDGVIIGDVVGLGKTLMATAVARIFEDDYGLETLILCPKNLVPMWEQYVHDYRLRGKVLSMSRVLTELPELRRYRLLVIDESQNLRNREGKRYRAIQEYITENESRCILLSATPYNKSYLDLSSQLRLFIPEHHDLGMRPEHLIRDLGETEFIRRHQAPLRSLAAFEKSDYPDDWRELMRLYLVRRTRSFIQENYAFSDNGRTYLILEDGTRSYFPNRIPRTLKFDLNEQNPTDQYARLYSDRVVDIINGLSLPRYGLGKEDYISKEAEQLASSEEKKQLYNLSRAGKRLMGFCRTNLFKRLESSGQAFLQSMDRHILRNYVYIHAIDNDLPIPIGTQSAELLDASANDEDADAPELMQAVMDYDDESNEENNDQVGKVSIHPYTEEWYTERAKQLYEVYSMSQKKRFRWLRPVLFTKNLHKDLMEDAEGLLRLLHEFGEWDPHRDTKLAALDELLTKRHPGEKVLVFTQFADTVRYLTDQLKARNIDKLEGVTGQSPDPTAIAWRFSPRSNERTIDPKKELRVLISTDVLSEGQNLQDCALAVNYDLPWALIRLVQRVGRVDRIGQKAENITCYSFLPAEGLENIIRLRSRVKQRITESGEVLGSDENYFEDDLNAQVLRDLYTEKSGILDGDLDSEVDLASYAYQIWHNATKDDPTLAKKIADLPDVVFSTRQHTGTAKEPEGVLVYMKTADGNDSLVWMSKEGKSVTQSQLAVLRAAECTPETPAIPRNPRHHELVRQGIDHIIQQEKAVGGQLGRPSGARYRTYERLKHYYDELKKHEPLFAGDDLTRAIDDIYRYPLRSSATDTLNRQLRAGISDEDLATLVISLRDENRLSIIHEEEEPQEPRIICSIGLFGKEGEEQKP
jgi:superfamily II DNA or RNA helicase